MDFDELSEIVSIYDTKEELINNEADYEDLRDYYRSLMSDITTRSVSFNDWWYGGDRCFKFKGKFIYVNDLEEFENNKNEVMMLITEILEERDN